MVVTDNNDLTISAYKAETEQDQTLVGRRGVSVFQDVQNHPRNLQGHMRYGETDRLGGLGSRC